MVEGLQRQRISTDREIRHQRAWVEAELKDGAMAVQVKQAEGRMAELAAAQSQARSLRDQGCVLQVQQVDQLQDSPGATDGAADGEARSEWRFWRAGEAVLVDIGGVGADSRAGQEEPCGSSCRAGATDGWDGRAGQASGGAGGPPGQAGLKRTELVAGLVALQGQDIEEVKRLFQLSGRKYFWRWFSSQGC